MQGSSPIRQQLSISRSNVAVRIAVPGRYRSRGRVGLAASLLSAELSCTQPQQPSKKRQEAILCKRTRCHESALTAALVLKDKKGDARELVTASLDKSLALWRLQDGDLSESRAVPMAEVARLKPAGGPIFSLVADSTSLGNHKQVFCGNHSKSVLSWEPPDKEMIAKVVLSSHTGWVRSLATSGKWLFSCGCNYIKQWDMSRAVPRHVRDIKLFTGDILGLCTGNNRLFACTSRGSIKSWTVDKKGELREAAGRDKAHSDRVTSVLWHKGFLYSTSYDGSIKMWDANTMELVGEKNHAHEGQRVNCAAVGPDRMLYTGGDDKLVRRWELALLEAPDCSAPLEAPDCSVLLEAPDCSALFCHHYPVRVLAAGKHDTLVSGDSSGELAVWTVS